MSLIDFAYFLCLKNHIAEHHQITISSKTDLRKLVVRLERTLHNRYMNRRHLTDHLKATRSPTHQTEQTNLANQNWVINGITPLSLTATLPQNWPIWLCKPKSWRWNYKQFFTRLISTTNLSLGRSYFDWQLCDTKTKVGWKHGFNSELIFGMNCN